MIFDVENVFRKLFPQKKDISDSEITQFFYYSLQSNFLRRTLARTYSLKVLTRWSWHTIMSAYTVKSVFFLLEMSDIFACIAAQILITMEIIMIFARSAWMAICQATKK